MGQITKPDVNPIVPALLNALTGGFVGYWMLGQQKKAIISLIATVLTSWMCVGIAVPVIAAYDAYLLGEKLKTGQAIGENESALQFLNAVFK